MPRVFPIFCVSLNMNTKRKQSNIKANELFPPHKIHITHVTLFQLNQLGSLFTYNMNTQKQLLIVRSQTNGHVMIALI